MRWKRIVCCTMVAMCLVSCTPKGEKIKREEVAAQISKPFESGVTLQYKDLHVKGSVKKDAEGGFSVAFLGPPNLVDIHFLFVEENVKISYKDLSFTMDRESAGGSTVVSMLVSTINSAIEDTGVQLAMDENVITIQGEIESANFILTIERNTGNFLKLEIPNNDFLMEFNNFTFA